MAVQTTNITSVCNTFELIILFNYQADNSRTEHVTRVGKLYFYLIV